jgi:hypothetical protein
MRPVNVALVMRVCCVSTKSSAVSVSWLTPLVGPGRDAVAMRPSGLPVLKEKASARAGGAANPAAAINAAPSAAMRLRAIISLPNEAIPTDVAASHGGNIPKHGEATFGPMVNGEHAAG